jgi:hypothetical protein
MTLHTGAPVYSAQGHEVGYVNFLAVDRETRKLQYVVVRLKRTPFLNKLVPLKLIASAEFSRLALTEAAGDLEAMVDFTEVAYVPLAIDDWNAFQRVSKVLQPAERSPQKDAVH